ncbi:MAG: hypothetical protein ACOY9J_03385 [Pseudomonadota bacterium]
MEINFRSDVNRLLKKNDAVRNELLKAAARAINDTAAKVRIAAIDEIAARSDGYSKSVLRGYVTVRKAKFVPPRLTKAGALRSNYAGISATVSAAGKAPNLIYFVPPAARTPAAWRQGEGVAAHVVGKTTVYRGSFVVRTKSGKMVVVSRSAKAKASSSTMRIKGQWQRGWSKGLYGPALKSAAGNHETQKAMRSAAKAWWPSMWAKHSARVLSGGE